MLGLRSWAGWHPGGCGAPHERQRWRPCSRSGARGGGEGQERCALLWPCFGAGSAHRRRSRPLASQAFGRHKHQAVACFRLIQEPAP